MKQLSKETMIDWLIVLLIFSLMVLVGNLLGYGGELLGSLKGMGWLLVITFLGLILKEIIPFDLPAAAYISLVGILFAIPWSPISAIVISDVENISLLAICTPILGYAGVTVGRDWPAFKQIGFKGIIVSLLVIVGTVISCVLLSELFFRIF
ncbi:hypothetical protein HZY86_05120 [Aerococcaceae bacterium DSM 111020]|nr:hypothetical protein [Aerococcaceae bacterium DSM 111020]